MRSEKDVQSESVARESVVRAGWQRLLPTFSKPKPASAEQPAARAEGATVNLSRENWRALETAMAAASAEVAEKSEPSDA